jgi:glycosyltransferase involved in cell wall biosynthesis
MGAPIRVGLDGHAVGRRQAGNETYILGLATALAARSDMEPIIYLGPRVGWPEDRRPAPATRSLRAERAQLRIGLELPFRAVRDRLDLLHGQYVAPPVATVPIVTSIHDVSFLDLPTMFPTRRRWRLRATVRHAIGRSAVVITPSAFSRERLLAHYSVDPARVVVAPPVVPAPNWEPAGVPRQDATGAPGVPGAFGGPDAGEATGAGLGPGRVGGLPATFVLAVGDLHARKNLARLVEAVGRTREQGLDLNLVLAGQTGYGGDALAKVLDGHAATAWTHRLGYVDTTLLRRLYRAASAVAYLSIYEGFGLPVIEAMAAGTPVVASRSSSIVEVAGDAALLVEPTDVEAIAAALKSAVTDAAVRRRLIEAGRRRALVFSGPEAIEPTIEAYRLALEMSPRGALSEAAPERIPLR